MRAGMDQYGALAASGEELSPEILSLFLLVKLDGWDPEFQGEAVLDPEARQALATFLGHLVFRLGTIHHARGAA